MRYKNAAFLAAGLLVLALADLPHGYYTFLRLVVCAAAVFGAFKASEANSEGWAVVLGGTALLFNPLFPVHFERGLWNIVDLAVAVLLVASVYKIGENDKPSGG